MPVSRQSAVQLAALVYQLRDKMVLFAPVVVKAQAERWGVWKMQGYNKQYNEISALIGQINAITTPPFPGSGRPDPFREVDRQVLAAFENSWDLLEAIGEGRAERSGMQKKIKGFFVPLIEEVERILS